MRRLLTIVLLACAACWRRHDVPIPDGLLPPSQSGLTVYPGVAAADSAESIKPRVRIVAQGFSGDSRHRAVEDAIATLTSYDARRTDTVRLRPSLPGTYDALAQPGKYALVVRRIGYETYRDSVTVRSASTDTLNIRLRTACVMIERSSKPSTQQANVR